MANYLQNFFQVYQPLLRRWDFCRAFYFLLEQLEEFVLIVVFRPFKYFEMLVSFSGIQQAFLGGISI